MDQRSIFLYLAMKRLSAQAIYNLATGHEQIWLLPGETPPERARHTIQDRKIMATIAWNPLGFPLIVAVPKGRTFNAEYYHDNILAALTRLQSEDDGRKLVVHADNARAHTAQKRRTFCKENGLRLVLYSAYSADLAPSDFFLFRHIKYCLGESLFYRVRNYRVVQKSVSYPSISTDNLLAWPNLLSNHA
jgi:hypothetical protein